MLVTYPCHSGYKLTTSGYMPVTSVRIAAWTPWRFSMRIATRTYNLSVAFTAYSLENILRRDLYQEEYIMLRCLFNRPGKSVEIKGGCM
jgi:hypothetical protein